MKKLLIISALLSCFCLLSCANLKDWAKTEAKEVAVKEIGTLVSKRLPEDKREQFDAIYAESPKDAIVFATETIGVDKLADALEEAGVENKRLADELREGGADYAKVQWAAILAALLGGGGTILGIKKSSKWLKVLRAVIQGVDVFISSEHDAAPLKAEIKKATNAAGVRHTLDMEVAKTTRKS